MARRLADPYGESNCTILMTMRPFAESCVRNQSAILEVLEIELAEPATVLEIGSGDRTTRGLFCHQAPTHNLAHQ